MKRFYLFLFTGMFLVITGSFLFVMQKGGNIGRVFLATGAVTEILTVLVFVFKRSVFTSK